MERFVKGDVVVLPFPFTDLSSSKKRPALVLIADESDDIVLCQITSKTNDKSSVFLRTEDLANGQLPVNSFIRTTKLFTADKVLISYKVGSLKKSKLNEAISKLTNILKN